MSLLAPATADTCLVCRADHEALDRFWACPPPPEGHGHKLKFSHHDGDMDVYRCPAHRCPYTRAAPPKPRSPSKGDPMTTVQTRPSVAIDAMWANSKRLGAMLSPLGIEVNLFIATAAGALYNNADLMACAEQNPASLLIALTECAGLGHLPGTKDYYLTPRGLKGAKSGPQVLGIEGYQGIIERYYRSGEVRKVVVREVCANDYFRYVEGEDEHPIHRFASGPETTGAGFFGPEGRVDRGPMVGVYCAVQSVDGHWYRPAILSRDDVYAARDTGGYSPADTHSPWNRYDAGKDQPGFRGRSMWWKTAAKRAEPWTPTSAEDKRQRARAAQAVSVSWEGQPVAQALPERGERDERRRALTPPQREAVEALKAGEVKADIRVELERLGIVDPEECDNTVRNLTAEDDLSRLTGDDLAKVLTTLVACDQVGELYDITGQAS